MKKRVTQLAALLLCGTMLAACGGKDVSAASSAKSKSETASSSAEETADSADEAENDVEDAAEKSESAENADDTEATEEHAAEGSSDSSSEMAENAAKDPILDVPTIEGEYTLADCVKLGDYKNLKLEMEIQEVTDEDVDTYISYLIQPEEVKDDEAVLGEGDTANLDFTGYLDGDAFPGGSSTGYDLEIGSGSFIPGFEDGMVGMKKGEERDLPLTFPENYSSEELAGKEVIFHVKLNAIKRMPELSDEWVKTYTKGEQETVEDFREATRADLEKQNRSYAEANLQTKAWEQVMENAEILALPEVLLQVKRDEYNGYLESEAEMYGYSPGEYIQQMGMTREQFDQINEVQVRYEVENGLVLGAVAEAEGITEEDPVYKEELTRLQDAYGMTEADLKDNYGEEVLKQHLRSVAVMKKIISYADITEKMVSDEE